MALLITPIKRTETSLRAARSIDDISRRIAGERAPYSGGVHELRCDHADAGRRAFEKAIDANKKRRLELYKAVSSKLEELAH